MNLLKKAEGLIDKVLEKGGLSVPLIIEKQDFLENIKEAIHYPKPKSQLLPYRFYDEDTGIYFNDNGSLGFTIEIAPQVGASELLLEQFKHFLKNSMPQNSIMQVMCFASNNTEHHFDKYLNTKKPINQDHAEILLKRTDYLRSVASREKDLGVIIRDFRCFFSFSLAGKKQEISNKAMSKFKKQFLGFLKSSAITNRELKPVEFLDLVHELLNGTTRSQKTYKKNVPIADQIISKNYPLVDMGDQLVGKDGLITRIYETNKLSDEESIFCMSNLIGDHLQDSLNIMGSFIICYTVAKDLGELDRSLLESKGRSNVENSTSFFSRFNLSVQKDAKEWQVANHLLGQGEDIFTTSLQVMIRGQNAHDMEESEQGLRSLFSKNEWEVSRIENDLALACFINMMPQVPASGTFKELKYFGFCKTAFISEVLALLPIYGEWKGTKAAGMLLVGRRGQLMHFFPFDESTGNTNYNISVVAPSGGGKSVFSQELVNILTSHETQVFIFDVGKSYEKLCESFKGELIEFSFESDISLNFFCDISGDNDDIAEFLDSAARVVISMASPSGNLNDISRSIVMDSVIKAWKVFGTSTTITKIVEILREEGSIEARDIARMLSPYTKDGMYGKFFESTTALNFKNKVVVLEFERIRSKPDLLSIVMQIFSLKISQKFTGDRKSWFAMLFDEFQGYGIHLQTHVEWLSRSIRKYGGLIAVITQLFEDFQKNEKVKTIWANCNWHIFLPHQADNIKNLRATQSELLGDSFLDLLSSARMVKPKYSEVVISSSNVNVVGRLMLDPTSNLLFSTQKEDFTRMQELRKQGMSVSEAIAYLLKKEKEAA